MTNTIYHPGWERIEPSDLPEEEPKFTGDNGMGWLEQLSPRARDCLMSALLYLKPEVIKLINERKLADHVPGIGKVLQTEICTVLGVPDPGKTATPQAISKATDLLERNGYTVTKATQENP